MLFIVLYNRIIYSRIDYQSRTTWCGLQTARLDEQNQNLVIFCIFVRKKINSKIWIRSGFCGNNIRPHVSNIIQVRSFYYLFLKPKTLIPLKNHFMVVDETRNKLLACRSVQSTFFRNTITRTVWNRHWKYNFEFIYVYTNSLATILKLSMWI